MAAHALTAGFPRAMLGALRSVADDLREEGRRRVLAMTPDARRELAQHPTRSSQHEPSSSHPPNRALRQPSDDDCIVLIRAGGRFCSARQDAVSIRA